MIRQDDKILNAMSDIPFKEYGCALFCIQYLAVMNGSKTFTREHLIMDCDRWIEKKIISPKTFVLDWDELAHDSGLKFDLVIENRTHKLPAERKLKENELQLLYLHHPPTGYRHFVVGDEFDHIIFDPLGNSITGIAFKHGFAHIENKRVFRRDV